MKILTDQGYVEAVGMFFELDDEQLEIVRDNSSYYTNKKLVQEFNESKGDNAHFFGLCNEGTPELITKNLTQLLKDYKTVSWWNRDNKEFKIVKGGGDV